MFSPYARFLQKPHRDEVSFYPIGMDFPENAKEPNDEVSFFPDILSSFISLGPPERLE